MSLPDFDALWNYRDPAGTELLFRELLAAHAEPHDCAWRAELLTQVARCHSLRSQFKEAHALLDEAASLESAREARPAVRLALERGRAFNSAGDRDQAAQLFRLAWQTASDAHEDALAADAAHMVAIAEPENAVEWNQVGIALAEASPDARARAWKGSLLNNLGWTHCDAGRLEEALDCFTAARQARVDAGQADRVREADWCVAHALRLLGRPHDAIPIMEHVRERCVAAGDDTAEADAELALCRAALAGDAAPG